MPNKTKHTIKQPSKLPFLLVLLALVLVAAIITQTPQGRFAKTKPLPSGSPVAKSQSSYDPKANSEQAQRLAATPTPSPVAATAKTQLKPTITGVDGDSNSSSTLIAVDALSDGATSGTCTLTLTQNGQTFTATSSVAQIATYYGCNTLKLDKSKLSAGSASITVSVSSATAAGTSDARTIMIAK